MNIRSLIRRFRRSRKGEPRNRLVCSDCGAHIHRRERYTIIAVRHRDCTDRKQVGQMSLPAKEEVQP